MDATGAVVESASARDDLSLTFGRAALMESGDEVAGAIKEPTARGGRNHGGAAGSAASCACFGHGPSGNAAWAAGPAWHRPRYSMDRSPTTLSLHIPEEPT